MYPWELKQFIEDRNYYLGGKDLLKAISLEENNQLNCILYIEEEKKYKMWDREGNYYEFKAMTYEEAKIKELVKK